MYNSTWSRLSSIIIIGFHNNSSTSTAEITPVIQTSNFVRFLETSISSTYLCPYDRHQPDYTHCGPEYNNHDLFGEELTVFLLTETYVV